LIDHLSCALWYAYHNKNIDMIKLLLEEGASPLYMERFEDGTLMEEVIKKEEQELLELLLSYVQEDCSFLLSEAAQTNNIKILTLIINHNQKIKSNS